MKIVYLSPIGRIGGAERVLLELIAGLRVLRPEFRLDLIAFEDGPLLEEARMRGASAVVVPLPEAVNSWGESAKGQSRTRLGSMLRMVRATSGLVASVRALRSALAERAPDLVHTNGLKAHVLGRAATPGHVPLVWHLHEFLGGRAVARRLLRALVDARTHGIAVSEVAAADARRTIPRLPITVVHNALDLARFRPDENDIADLEGRAGCPPSPPETVRIGLVATYARSKGHEVFLEAAAALLRSRPADTRRAAPVRFFIIGGPIYRTGSQFDRGELERMAERLGIGDRLCFVEHCRDIAPVYRALDIVVHASVRPETFGMTIAEAMACGRPTIVSLAGGVGELVTPGEDALAVPPGDPASLAATIERLAGDPTLRSTLGRAAREAARARFDRDRMTGQIVAMYESLRETRS